jgi:hypothetical protein
MADWTTKNVSEDVEIDLHYDLESFPAVIRRLSTDDKVVLNKAEVKSLYQVLKKAVGRESTKSVYEA